MRFEHVLVIGAGQMGSGIAQVVAASGRRVSLHDAAPGVLGGGDIDWFDRSVKRCSWRNVRILAEFI